MSQPEESKPKLTLQDRVEDFSKKTFEQSEAKKVLVRNLKSLMHKAVRIHRRNLLPSTARSSLPLHLIQPGAVARRRFGDAEWSYGDFDLHTHKHDYFAVVVGMVIGYEVDETKGSAYLIVAAQNDRFEWKFDVGYSEFEVLDGFPA